MTVKGVIVDIVYKERLLSLFAGRLCHTDIIAQRPHLEEKGVALRDAEIVSKQSMIQPGLYK